jgi:SAM-dependent methyltransferase
MDDWIDYYDSAHTIYVNARHRDVHFRTIAEDLATYVTIPTSTVVDYGCGEALHAELVAARCARLLLVEAAPGVRARLARRYQASPKIEVATPDALAARPDASVDLIIMHSVSQYLAPDELDAVLALFGRLLAPNGTLLVGDVLQPNTSAVTDAVALLRFGARHGFLFAAASGLLRTFFSRYWRLRTTLGLTRYGEGIMIRKLAAAGLAAKRAPRNIGHNQARMSFLAHPARP